MDEASTRRLLHALEVGDVTGTTYGFEAVLYSRNQQFNPALLVDNFGKANQFAQKAKCPEDGVFAGPTYCDTIIR